MPEVCRRPRWARRSPTTTIYRKLAVTKRGEAVERPVDL